ncbi:hypothetical protein [Leptolyngbya sp. NIES-2104]|uniref:hypothetical protein n=1 Tax=Leptolyngbya sp. NIES-2104 TaxID=1552121 RepID=UPI0006EC774E|nr:hypothetical protein [Leptolyngbya sp. NIES-2104]GAP99125.1 hypothetical protein NIES2104_56830 [Leptolyngbya sp. NIES-2104]
MNNKFSPPEFIQDTIRKTINKEVMEWFKDVTDDDDISTPRGALKRACTHVENDNNDMTMLRMLLFYMVCGAMDEPRGWLAPEREIITMEGNPQVILLFAETKQSMKARKAKKRHTMRCSFRLLKEDFATSADEAKIDRLAMSIKRNFPQTFKHQVAQTTYAYVDKANGYQLRIAAFQENDARDLVRKLLDCSLDQSISFDESKFSRASTKRRSTPPTKRILGETKRLGDRRPTAIMTLQQADLFIAGYGSRTLLLRQPR